MLAALLINVGQERTKGGRHPPNLLIGGGKHKQNAQVNPDYSHLITWFRKQKSFESIASKEVVDKIKNSGIIDGYKDLLYIDDEEALILILIAMES